MSLWSITHGTPALILQYLLTLGPLLVGFRIRRIPWLRTLWARWSQCRRLLSFFVLKEPGIFGLMVPARARASRFDQA